MRLHKPAAGGRTVSQPLRIYLTLQAKWPAGIGCGFNRSKLLADLVRSEVLPGTE